MIGNNLVKDRLTLYHSLILQKMPMLLSLQDREIFSPTYGSFDRTYWQWKFLDFSCARFQEALFILSYVFTHNFEDNVYYQNKKVLGWVEAGFLFSHKIQHKDGSFDEAYPNERSFVATGFFLFYATEAFLLVGEYLDMQVKVKTLDVFNKAARWLCINDETHAFISNHRLGACAGLYNCSKILNDSTYENRCWQIWESVKEKQSVDGWFNEYGGADPGYLTQAIYYGAVLYERSRKEEVLHSLRRAIDFIRYFITPDGSIGGEYGSRNTEFYFPGGFEVLAKYDSIAASICVEMIKAIEQKTVVCVDNVDNYNMIPILNSIISGCLSFSSNVAVIELLPCQVQADFVKLLDDFRIYVRKLGNLYIIIGLAKGGVVKVYDIAKKQLIKSFSGVFGNFKGAILTTQFLHRKHLSIEINDNIILVKGRLAFANFSLLSPSKIILLRILGKVLCFNSFTSRYIKRILVNKLIFRERMSNWSFERQITINAIDGVIIDTIIKGLPKELFHEVDKHTSYHMGSSKYYIKSELITQ